MQKYSTDQLVLDILAIDNTPVSQQTFSQAQIVQYMDEELRGAIVPLFTKVRDEYFVHTWKFPVNPGDKGFTIPTQATGFRLRDIYLYDANDNFIAKFIRINPDQIPNMSGFNMNTLSSQSYYIENNEIVFFPKLTMTGNLKVRYFKAPNHLGLSAECGGQITGLLGGNQLQLDNVPTSWTVFSGPNAVSIDMTTPYSPYNFVDFVQGTNLGQPVINSPLVSTTIGNIITVDNDTYASATVGSYIFENDRCSFVQFLPFEALQLIKLRASMRILKAQGDLTNLSVTAQLYNAAADDMTSLLTPKIENQPKVITPSGMLARGFRRYR